MTEEQPAEEGAAEYDRANDEVQVARLRFIDEASSMKSDSHGRADFNGKRKNEEKHAHMRARTLFLFPFTRRPSLSLLPPSPLRGSPVTR